MAERGNTPMAKEVQSIDVSNAPEILRLAEEVQQSQQPRLLTRDDEQLAVIMPLRQARRRGRRTGLITREDPFVRMAGTGDSGIPGGISGRKYDYFRRAFGVEEQGG
jgi:hypothetical protein